MKGIIALSLLPLLAAGSPVIVDTIHNNAAPVISSSNAKEVPDSYMVIFKKHVTQRDASAHHSWVQDVHLSTVTRKQELRKRSQTIFSDDTIFEGLKHTYNIAGGLLGYAGHFDEDVIELVRRHPDVSLPILPRAPIIQAELSTLFHQPCESSIHGDFLHIPLCSIATAALPNSSSRAHSGRLHRT